MNDYLITSERLALRRWRIEDTDPFIKMNGDPEVMRFFPATLSPDESTAYLDGINRHFDNFGYGLYAAEEIASGDFIGFIGFQRANFKSDFTPCIEIGWRLLREHWNKGFATEGARACLRYGFQILNLQEIFSFTASVNLPSIKVMEKIGLIFRKNFGHPKLNPESELFIHVLYSLKSDEYKK